MRHPGVHTIAFTGSGAVGPGDPARTPPRSRDGQRHLKRVIAEMGGKNCVIVDSDADLDDAVPAIVQLAPSSTRARSARRRRACSSHEAIADALVERLAGAVEVLDVGQADDVRDRRAAGDRARRAGARRAATQERAAQDGTHRRPRRAACPSAAGTARPTLAVDLPADSPVLQRGDLRPAAGGRARGDVEEACERVDALPYALTGGLFCAQPGDGRARRRRARPVGNLYVNRAITGAMVGRQPFGGNRLSGTGTKAGGPAYLLQFVEPRVVTENTVRHGLVVE